MVADPSYPAIPDKLSHIHHMPVLVEHVIDDAFRHRPQPKDVTLEEHAGIHGAVSCFDLFRQAQVVVHGEMDVQQLLQARVFPFPPRLFLEGCRFLLAQVSQGLIDPVGLEPMVGPVRIAVEPIF